MNARLTVSRSSHVCLSLAKPSHLTLLSKRVRRETRRSRNLGTTTPKEHRSEPHSYSHPAYRELDDHRAGSGPMTVPVGQLTVENLLSPSLPGASCTGMAPHFDDVVPGESLEDREARLACAVRVCEHCPALVPCRALLAELPAAATGVWAGVVIEDGRARRRMSRA